jgi:hypothetical protein
VIAGRNTVRIRSAVRSEPGEIPVAETVASMTTDTLAKAIRS